MYNFKNKNLFSGDLFNPDKNQRYYYDFGTGNKIERKEVKEERDAFLEAVNKTSNKPKTQEKDAFLEGFNDPYGEKREQERKQKEQERKEKFANIRANADNRASSSQSILSSQTDPFLEGFNQDKNEKNKWIRAVDTIGRVSRAYEDFQDKISPYVQIASLFSPSASIRFATDLAVAPLKKAHYSRNDKNVPVPKTINEAKAWGWQEEDQNYCHNFDTPDISNVKYVPTDEGGEQIFDSKGNVVASPENMATYNLFHPQKEKAMHLFADVAPWVLWGNSPDDSTARLERIVTPLVLKYYKENVLPRISDSSGVSDR